MPWNKDGWDPNIEDLTSLNCFQWLKFIIQYFSILLNLLGECLFSWHSSFRNCNFLTPWRCQLIAATKGVALFTYALGSGADTTVTRRLACENKGWGKKAADPKGWVLRTKQCPSREVSCTHLQMELTWAECRVLHLRGRAGSMQPRNRLDNWWQRQCEVEIWFWSNSRPCPSTTNTLHQVWRAA